MKRRDFLGLLGFPALLGLFVASAAAATPSVLAPVPDEAEIRRLARRNAVVAIKRLQQIAANGRDEIASAIASKALLDLGYGVPAAVGPTRHYRAVRVFNENELVQISAALQPEG